MTTGFVKPDGLPTFKGAHALASGMLFYGVDLGDGTIVDVASGTTVHTTNAPASTSGTFGKGIQWNGTHEQNYQGYATTPAAVKTAAGMSARGSGAGFTFGCTCVLLADVAGETPWIFGQPANAFESEPYLNWGFAGSTGNKSIFCGYNNNSVQQYFSAFTGPTYNSTLIRLVCSVTNTSSGVSTAKFFANGTLIDTKTGITFAQVSSLEDEMQFGNVFHVGTGVSKDCSNGYVYSGFAKDGAWSDAECQAWMANPYDILSYPGDTTPNTHGCLLARR